MQVEELVVFCDWVLEWINDELLKQYQDFARFLSRYPPPESNFDNRSSTLVDLLVVIPLDRLTFSQIQLLKKFGVDEVIGEKGANIVLDQLDEQGLPKRTRSDDQDDDEQFDSIWHNHKKLADLKEWVESVFDPLSDVFEETELGIGSDEGLVYIFFAGNAAVDNFDDLKKWANVWQSIGYAICRANSRPIQDIKIIGASRGSVILELVTDAKLLGMLAAIVFGSLKIIKETYTIRKLQKEIENQELKNKKIEEVLNSEAEVIKQQGLRKLIINICDTMELSVKEHNEQIECIKRAAKRVFDFIECGGAIEVSLPIAERKQIAEGTLLAGSSELLRKVHEMRELAKEIQLLEKEKREG